MRNAIDKALVILLLSLLMVGCRAKKSVVETSYVDMEAVELISASPSVVSPITCLSGNLKLYAIVDGNPVSAKGTMRIKEGYGVQMGMTALGLVEVACLEFLPQSMRLIYKLGKEYADIPYADVSFLQKSGIDYAMLESVLLNRLFSPDGRPFMQAMNDMTFAHEDDCVTATTARINGIVYKFYIEKATCRLVQSEGTHIDGGKLVCSYSDFTAVNGMAFPHTISLTLEGVGSTVTLQFVLDRVDTGDFNFTPRRVSSYGELDIEHLLKSLGNM